MSGVLRHRRLGLWPPANSNRKIVRGYPRRLHGKSAVRSAQQRIYETIQIPPRYFRV